MCHITFVRCQRTLVTRAYNSNPSITQKSKKCLNSELFWSVFSRIRTEYWDIQSISLYSVRMRENANQRNSEYGHFSRSETLLETIQLDDYITRSGHWKHARFAAAVGFFNSFNKSCGLHQSITSEFITINKTLYPYKGKVVIRYIFYHNKSAFYIADYQTVKSHAYTLPYAGK